MGNNAGLRHGMAFSDHIPHTVGKPLKILHDCIFYDKTDDADDGAVRDCGFWFGTICIL